MYRDGAGKLLPLQSQHEKALDASSVTFVLVSRGAISKKEIEAIMEADGKFAVSIELDCGDAWPFVRCAEMVQKLSRGAHKAAGLTRAVAWRVGAHRSLAFLIIVGRPQGTAMGRVRAWDADRLHGPRTAMAPAVAAGGNARHGTCPWTGAYHGTVNRPNAPRRTAYASAHIKR